MHAAGADLRIRFTAIFEWMVAALFLCATIGVGSLILNALLTPVAPATMTLGPSEPARPSSIPAAAVPVFELPLADGRLLQIGATLPATAALLGRAAETGRQESEQGRAGERLVRFYEHDGVRFILVFEPLERSGEARVTAIYVLR